MFHNPGEKLRVFATIQFVLCIICAAVILFAGLGTMGIAVLIYAVVMVFSGWISCLSLNALADAAEHAKTAAYYSEQIAMYINRVERSKGETEEKNEPQSAWHPDGKMPAWQRVEQEKAEAERKASEETEQ